jgi:hypothetical protein
MRKITTEERQKLLELGFVEGLDGDWSNGLVRSVCLFRPREWEKPPRWEAGRFGEALVGADRPLAALALWMLRGGSLDG